MFEVFAKGSYITIQCGFVFLSNSTICLYSYPRRLLPKLANHLPPIFLLVYRRQPSPSLNRRDWLHRNIGHIITPLQVPRRLIPNYRIKRHMQFWSMENVHGGVFQSLSPCSFCFKLFFVQVSLVWYGYKEVITCEVSFDIVWFD